MNLFKVWVTIGVCFIVAAAFSKDPELQGWCIVGGLIFLMVAILSTTRR